MHQTALGLDYLHGLEGNIIHRNIHARNVLVAEIVSGSNTRYVVKLSDFLFSKSIMNEWDQQQSNRPFPSGWTAPEIEKQGDNLGPWTDVFILACFFYYILSGGHHPYGKRKAKNVPNRSTNIKNKEYCWPKLKNDNKFTLLIKNMTKFAAEDRTSLSQVLQHFQRDAGYFPLYKGVNNVNKPGLCVIINQKEFPKMSKVLLVNMELKF